MNTVDIINKIATSNSLTTGRAEMIVSIVFEKISEKLKKDGEVTISNFGTFQVMEKKSAGISENNVKKYLGFMPDRSFLEKINS